MQKKGFTLIELVITIVVLAVIATTFFLRHQDNDGIKVFNAAERVAADIRYMRSLAISESRYFGVQFSYYAGPGGIASFLVYIDDSGNLAYYTDPTHNTGNSGICLLTSSDLGGVAFGPNAVDGTMYYFIVFDHEGKPMVGQNSGFKIINLVPLPDVYSIVFNKGSSYKQVRIKPNTGEVRVRDYAP